MGREAFHKESVELLYEWKVSAVQLDEASKVFLRPDEELGPSHRLSGCAGPSS
ncbi:hypothetical protein ACFWAP_10590 [Streptomyces goshikiensis]|uniref:hypothetical protein n=1 Tax=Streptomyces goshikiensis TaxID=1942 RepID=UPI0036479DA7